MQDSYDDECRIGRDVEHAKRKPLQQRPPNRAMDQRVSQWLLPDGSQAFVNLVQKLLP